MEAIYKEYVTEEFDDKGVLTKIDFKYPENFNFAFDVLDEIARRTPDAPALMWCDESGAERRFTFREMSELSSRAANVFHDLGIRKGDRVMLVLKRHYQFWYAIMGLCKIGAVAIPATHLLTTHDFTYRFNAAGVSAVVCTADGWTVPSILEAEAESSGLKHKLLVHGKHESFLDFDALIDAASPVFERPTGDQATANDDMMLLYFTSGTTGLPKMVAQSFTYPLAHIVTAAHWHRVERGKLHFTVAETGWGKAVWGKLYGQWLMEACVFVYDFDRFSGAEILSLIERYKITTLCCPPTMFRLMMQENVDTYDLSSLVYCTTAGEALNPDLFEGWREHTGLMLVEGFGQTETPLAVCNTVGMTPKPGSMGRPSPQYAVEIQDENGVRCAPGQTGEIVINIDPVRPAGIMMCYYRDEEKTAEAMHDGWYHTGDIAWYDEDGYFWYVGRNDDVIKSSGYRIGPFEVESVLLEHDAVRECAVTGVPDPVRGKAVKATIVLAPGFEPSEAFVKELQSWVKKRTAPYKYPRIIDFVDALPKTVNGKIRRAAIRDNDAGNKEE